MNKTQLKTYTSVQLAEYAKQIKQDQHLIFPHEPIAIIGVGCQFPGDVNSPDALWKILQNGVHTISELPQDRILFNTFKDDNHALQKIYGGFIHHLKNCQYEEPLH